MIAFIRIITTLVCSFHPLEKIAYLNLAHTASAAPAIQTLHVSVMSNGACDHQNCGQRTKQTPDLTRKSWNKQTN